MRCSLRATWRGEPETLTGNEKRRLEPIALARDLEFRQRLFQASDPGGRYFGVRQVQLLELLETAQCIQACIGDLRVAQAEIAQPHEALEVLQTRIRHGSVPEIERFEL